MAVDRALEKHNKARKKSKKSRSQSKEADKDQSSTQERNGDSEGLKVLRT